MQRGYRVGFHVLAKEESKFMYWVGFLMSYSFITFKFYVFSLYNLTVQLAFPNILSFHCIAYTCKAIQHIHNKHELDPNDDSGNPNKCNPYSLKAYINIKSCESLDNII